MSHTAGTKTKRKEKIKKETPPEPNYEEGIHSMTQQTLIVPGFRIDAYRDFFSREYTFIIDPFRAIYRLPCPNFSMFGNENHRPRYLSQFLD